MRFMKWLGLSAALLLIVSCFMTWVSIPSRNIIVTGVDATGTNFGKPAYLHFFLLTFFIVFSLVPKVWAKRANLLVVALNLAWAMRNYFLISACSGGECPEKSIGIVLALISAIVMLICSLFPDGVASRK